uniref:DET1- and DDB1-associated protein 1 n=2 Tax=Clytia hemisphaerica TaxID=252671 RepID=A0A7M5UM25_9CNID
QRANVNNLSHQRPRTLKNAGRLDRKRSFWQTDLDRSHSANIIFLAVTIRNKFVIIMTANDLLKGLPSFNKENFSDFKPDENIKSTNTGCNSYIHTEDQQEEEPQVIITDKTNILLRFLRKQLESKKPSKRNTSAASAEETEPSPKLPRLDTTVDEND